MEREVEESDDEAKTVLDVHEEPGTNLMPPPPPVGDDTIQAHTSFWNADRQTQYASYLKANAIKSDLHDRKLSRGIELQQRVLFRGSRGDMPATIGGKKLKASPFIIFTLMYPTFSLKSNKLAQMK